MPCEAQNSELNQRSVMLASLVLGLIRFSQHPGLGSSGCLSEDIRAVPTAWREEHWEQTFQTMSDRTGPVISFLGTMDTLFAALHVWKPTELGTVDLSKKANTEYHQKPTSTSHYQPMSFQPSWHLQISSLKLLGKTRAEPKQLQTIEGKVFLKTSSIWLVYNLSYTNCG